jgi:predicted alpha/beta hydrolase
MNPLPPGESPARFERQTLRTPDGTAITVRRYDPPHGSGAARARLVVAGATGVPQAFYRRFAEHAAERGFATLTLDYRGIGESKPASLRGFEMEYLDWAREDLATALGAWHDPALPLFMIGHSFGGHAFGLLPDPNRVQRFYTFATGAGWHGWMPRAERLRVWAMWNLVGPLWTRWKGYLPWSHIGMGEDLPLGVYTQWRHWCRFPRYFFDDPATPGIQAEFDRVRTPIVAANAVDDAWAPPRSRDSFMAGYRQAPVEHVDIDPASVSMRAIGHMGYFRPQARALWDQALDWFAADPSLKPMPAG